MVLLATKKVRAADIQEVENDTRSREAVAFCPECKAFQTVWFSGNTLIPTRKFNQAGSQVYHDCGSSQPCRLYYGW